ncbi:MAG: hypothetical protein ACR2J7_01220 [Luteimonas sp.]
MKQELSRRRASSFLLFAHCAHQRANGEAGPEGERQWRESKKRTKEKGLHGQSKPAN